MDCVLTLWAAADAETISTLSTVAKVTFNIILLILGLNALIIVHEFGHFAVARLCGVRCDKFYIWFDFFGLKFFKFKWGNTEYGLGMFPLGGYVKMLGQEDNPNELRAEFERAKQNEDAGENGSEKGTSISDASADIKPVHTEEELKEALFAPDSYLSKSVPQRMAIIVAGVAMNFLFAAVCAAAAYLIGVTETAPVAGNVVPGSPAWNAGLQSGDTITAINGNPVRMFTDINLAMVGSGSSVKLSIDRLIDGKAEQIEKELTPRKRKNDLAPSIGVTSMPSMEIASPEKPVHSWAEKFYLPGIADVLKRDGADKKGKGKWKIAEVNGVQIENYTQFLDESLKKNGEKIQCKLQYELQDEHHGKLNSKLSGGTETVEITLPAIPMRETGIRFQTGAITMVLPDSDAAKKGIEAGDTILSVDGKTDFDPLKLPQYILGKVNEGTKSVELLLRKKDGTEKTAAVELAPVRIIPNLGLLSMKDPVGSTALGLAWEVLPVIAAYDEEEITNPEKVSFIGGTVTDVSFINSEPLLRSATFASADKTGYHFHKVGDKIDIPYIFDTLLQLAKVKESDENSKNENSKYSKWFSYLSSKLTNAGEPDEKGIKNKLGIELTIDKDGKKQRMVIMQVKESKDWFNTERGLLLKSETTLVKCDDLATALSMGTAKTADYSLSIFKTLHALFSGSVSPRALGGPVMIVEAAYMYTEKGMGVYLLFLCLIGANLAVINILPVPVLDGGHLMFLLYEGIFRRPPNTTVLVILSYIGLFLILALMVWALSLDVSCIKRL